MTSCKRYSRIKYQYSPDIKILFVGTNPSLGSYYRKVPFSSNKSFWYLLHEAGLIPEDRSTLRNDKRLKEMFLTKFSKHYKLGLINLVYRPTKTISEIKQTEAIPGNRRILALIHKYHPPVVCFIGKGTYQLFTQTSHDTYGWQPSIDHSKIFVMHSPIHGFSSIRVNELKKVAKMSKLKPI